MPVSFLHLHTHFLFPFTIDRELVQQRHFDHFKETNWINGLDHFIEVHCQDNKHPVVRKIGPWRRAAYDAFDLDTRAYQDMVFFHPYVRHVFFDALARNGAAETEWESLIRCYEIDLSGKAVWLRADDGRTVHREARVTDLRLFLFANGLGILSIGVEAYNLPADDALWLNEMLRKVYPSSGRQGREGRAPNKTSLLVGEQEPKEVVVEDSILKASLRGFEPPLSQVIQKLLFFLEYDKGEYEQVLDDRMIVYSYGSVDPQSCQPDFAKTEEYQVLLSHFLYVDREMPTYRYEPEFVKKQLHDRVYTRWAHEGTYYGFTSYSNTTLCLGIRDLGHHSVKEGFLIHRMFNTRYYLMAIIGLFYRATLLDFAEKSALVSKRLYSEQESGPISRKNIELAQSLRSEFLHFTNYWFFEELANKEEENEHFWMLCKAYRLHGMKQELEEELGKMNSSLQEYYQNRNTEAVNRLAIMSLILGAGAVITGYFGMNFGREFGATFFEGTGANALWHRVAVFGVTAFGAGALALLAFVVGTNWADYKYMFIPRARRVRERPSWNSLRNPRAKTRRKWAKIHFPF